MIPAVNRIWLRHASKIELCCRRHSRCLHVTRPTATAMWEICFRGRSPASSICADDSSYCSLLRSSVPHSAEGQRPIEIRLDNLTLLTYALRSFERKHKCLIIILMKQLNYTFTMCSSASRHASLNAIELDAWMVCVHCTNKRASEFVTVTYCTNDAYKWYCVRSHLVWPVVFCT